MEEKLLKLSSKLENLINTEKQEGGLSKVKHIENKLSKKMNQLEKHIWGELEKMQSEYQSGEQTPLVQTTSARLSNLSELSTLSSWSWISLVIMDILLYLIGLS